jgi:dCMP deaminase
MISGPKGEGLMEEKHRTDYLKWDEYFMGIAQLSSLRSKDPSTQVGACIVDDQHKVVSIGYNGMPRGVDDEKVPWGHGEGLDSKYLYVCHAEFNAILNTRDGAHLNGCTLYVTLFPCNECAKAIIQVGIKEVVFLSDKYSEGVSFQASRKMFDMAGVKVRPYEGKTVTIAVK